MRYLISSATSHCLPIFHVPMTAKTGSGIKPFTPKAGEQWQHQPRAFTSQNTCLIGFERKGYSGVKSHFTSGWVLFSRFVQSKSKSIEWSQNALKFRARLQESSIRQKIKVAGSLRWEPR